MIGARFDAQSDQDCAALYRAAAREQIRLCEVFARTVRPESNTAKVHVHKASHYYESLNHTHFEMRPWYMKKLLSRDLYRLNKELEKVQQQLAKDRDPEHLGEEEILRGLSRATGKSFRVVTESFNELSGAMARVDRRLQRKLENGRVYPWDHLFYKITRTTLPHKDRKKYRGPVLKIEAENGEITGMSMQRRAPKPRF
jgi:chemotaxis protein histidine kinase CheA